MRVFTWALRAWKTKAMKVIAVAITLSMIFMYSDFFGPRAMADEVWSCGMQEGQAVWINQEGYPCYYEEPTGDMSEYLSCGKNESDPVYDCRLNPNHHTEACPADCSQEHWDHTPQCVYYPGHHHDLTAYYDPYDDNSGCVNNAYHFHTLAGCTLQFHSHTASGCLLMSGGTDPYDPFNPNPIDPTPGPGDEYDPYAPVEQPDGASIETITSSHVLWTIPYANVSGGSLYDVSLDAVNTYAHPGSTVQWVLKVQKMDGSGDEVVRVDGVPYGTASGQLGTIDEYVEPDATWIYAPVINLQICRTAWNEATGTFEATDDYCTYSLSAQTVLPIILKDGQHDTNMSNISDWQDWTFRDGWEGIPGVPNHRERVCKACDYVQAEDQVAVTYRYEGDVPDEFMGQESVSYAWPGDGVIANDWPEIPEGYLFTGWKVNGTDDIVSGGYWLPVEHATELVGTFTKNEGNAQTVTWIDGFDGSIIKQAVVNPDEDYWDQYPALPEREGISYIKWEDPIDENGNIIIRSQWESSYSPWNPDDPMATFTVTWTNGYDGTVIKEITINSGENYSDQAPAWPERDGYVCTGWNRVDDVDGNITYEATWQEIMIAPTMITVTWTNGYDGTVIKEISVNTGDDYSAEEPAWPERDGYVCTGWNRVDGENGNITYEAAWREAPVATTDTITVTWTNGYNGGIIKTITQAKGSDDFASNYPGSQAREGYRFGGWSQPSYDRNGNMTIQALWIENNDNGGATVGSGSGTPGYIFVPGAGTTTIIREAAAAAGVPVAGATETTATTTTTPNNATIAENQNPLASGVNQNPLAASASAAADSDGFSTEDLALAAALGSGVIALIGFGFGAYNLGMRRNLKQLLAAMEAANKE